MIIEIYLQNFKCFRVLKIQLAPMTLLAGLNGMGKSSVVQAILLLRQSYESGDLSNGELLLAGSLADLGSGLDVLYEDANEDLIEIGLLVGSPQKAEVLSFAFAYDREADRLRTLASPGRHSISYLDGPPFNGRLAFLSAERLGPRKTLPLSESRARKQDIGVQGEYALHVLIEQGSTLLMKDDPRIKDAPSLRISDQVDAWLQEISPGSHLDHQIVRDADMAVAGFTFDRPGDVASRRFRATNVGFGLSYVLPVIVALLTAEPGSLVIIENPEAHLHPRGQTRIGQLAARTASAGVQVIVETHSDHVMDGIRIDVREGRLASSSAAFHYFSRTGIEASVISPVIDANGRLSEWPGGFFDEHRRNTAALVRPKGA
jgi:predicted ATPase